MIFIVIQGRIKQLIFGREIRMNISFGYMRVSAKEQNLDRQLAALIPHVTEERYIFSDKASGKNMEREGFQNLLRAIREGDTLYVKSLDRLGRNKSQILECLQHFKQNNIRVKIIDLPTTMQDVAETQRWVIDMVNTILIEVFSTLAEQERDTLLQRQAEGIKAAKEKGKHLGRPVLKLPPEWNKLHGRWKAGELKTIDFIQQSGMKKATFYKKVKEYERSLNN